MVKISTTAPNTPLPGVYVQIQAAPKSVGLIPSDIVAVVGEFSRGPFDTPLYVESLDDVRRTFGGITANPNGAFQTPLSGYAAMVLLSQLGVQRKIGVRVGTALGSTAFLTLKNSSNPVVTLHAASPGTWANSNLQVVVTAGSVVNTFNLSIRNNATAENEYFSNLAYADLTALVNKINASSRLVVATLPVLMPPVAAPTFTKADSGGTIPAGTWYAVVTYTNANGETVVSPEATVITTTGVSTLTLSVPALTGATGWKAYVTQANAGAGNENYAFTPVEAPGTPHVQTAPWTATTIVPPQRGTATVAGNALMPDVGTYTMDATGSSMSLGTGHGPGADGANANTSRHVGAAGTPSTGVYSLQGLVPHPNFVLIAGTPGTDTTFWDQLAGIGMDNNWQHVAGVAPGTSVSAAVALMGANSLPALVGNTRGDFLKVSYPGIKWLEQELYNATLTSASQAPYSGITAVQIANTSAANKPFFGISGPEYNLSDTDKVTLINAGINPVGPNLVRNPDGSSTWGMVTDRCVSGRPAFEVRMQSLILENFAALVAPFVQVPNNPANRSKVSLLLTSWLDARAGDNLIPANPVGVTSATATATPTTTTAGLNPSAAATTSSGVLSNTLNYVVLCDSSNNVINGVTSSDLIVDVQVALWPNVEKVIFRATIGSTVQVTLVPNGSVS
jgi:hypothetical protein